MSMDAAYRAQAPPPPHTFAEFAPGDRHLQSDEDHLSGICDRRNPWRAFATQLPGRVGCSVVPEQAAEFEN